MPVGFSKPGTIRENIGGDVLALVTNLLWSGLAKGCSAGAPKDVPA